MTTCCAIMLGNEASDSQPARAFSRMAVPVIGEIDGRAQNIRD